MGFFIATLAEVDLFRISEHRLTALENYFYHLFKRCFSVFFDGVGFLGEVHY